MRKTIIGKVRDKIVYAGKDVNSNNNEPFTSSTFIGEVRKGDVYINDETGDIYECVVKGKDSNVIWVKKLNYQGKIDMAKDYVEEIKKSIEIIKELAGKELNVLYVKDGVLYSGTDY